MTEEQRERYQRMMHVAKRPSSTLRIVSDESGAILAFADPQTPPEAPQTPRKARKHRTVPPRLPDGAAFTLVYDGQTVQWHGILAVPGLSPLQANARTLFALCMKLDRDFRRSLKTPEEK